MLSFQVKVVFGLVMALIFIIDQAHPGDTVNPSVIGIRPQFAYVIIHSRDIRPMENTYPFCFGLDLKKRYTSRKTWETCNCYPMLGFSLMYWDFNNPEILGRGFSTLFFVEPFFGFMRKVNLSIRAGFGLAYLSNPYDEDKNPLNLSYSTHLGFPLLLSINLNYQLSPKFNINTGISYNHISNGGVKYPNKGINYPSIILGLDYYIKPAKYTQFPSTDWREEATKRKRNDILLFLASTSLEPNETERYTVFGLFYNFSCRVGRIDALNTGFEWVLDASLKEKISRDSLGKDYQRGSILIGHEFLLGQFTFSQQLGIYIYNPYKRNDAVYQRYGLNYFLNKRYIFGFNLKAHRYIADFIDFRFGISF